jgi:hypothetical protein
MNLSSPTIWVTDLPQVLALKVLARSSRAQPFQQLLTQPLLGWSSSIVYFMQLGFNLSNGVTDTLESSTILIYFKSRMSLYT